MAKSLSDLLVAYKNAENPESAVILLDDRDAQKIVAYWPYERSTWNNPPTKTPTGTANAWQWLWTGLKVNFDELALCSGVAKNNILQKFALVQANRLIYPDHTISKWASKILQAEVALKYETRRR